MNLLKQIEEAGIVGCGGAGFPTHVKLNCTVEHLIINAAECEPLLRTDRWLMIHKAPEIIAAIDRIAVMVQAQEIHIALKETYHQEIAALETAIKNADSHACIYRMKNFYPAGDEQIMVCDITGRTVPPAGIPLDVGAVVSNIATIFAIYEASQGQPLIRKYLTITGAVARPCIIHAPLGTSFFECLKEAGGTDLKNYHVVAGGPMMGKCYTMEEAADLVVTKTTSGFLILPDDTALIQKHDIPAAVSLKQAKMACIQCSYCTQMCPRYLTGHPLKPHMIMRKLAYAVTPEEVLDDTHVQQAMICSECGLCETYACPMGLQPRQVNIYIKNLLRKQNFRYSKPTENFQQLDERNYRRVASKRLAIRLGVDAYYDYTIDTCTALSPSQVQIPLRQHIGAPSAPVVTPGTTVTAGELIANPPDHALGAKIHASISGIITKITDSDITICAQSHH